MSTTTSARSTRRRPNPAVSRSLGAALVVQVHIHEDEGSWWAETPDYPGLTVVAPSRAELIKRIKPAVEFHLEECGVEFAADALSTYVFQPLELTA